MNTTLVTLSKQTVATMAVLMLNCAPALAVMRGSRLQLGQYEWVYDGNNSSRLLRTADKKIIAGGTLLLWADYPFIYGQADEDNLPVWFILDVSTDESLADRSPLSFPARFADERGLDTLKTVQDVFGNHSVMLELKSQLNGMEVAMKSNGRLVKRVSSFVLISVILLCGFRFIAVSFERCRRRLHVGLLNDGSLFQMAKRLHLVRVLAFSMFCMFSFSSVAQTFSLSISTRAPHNVNSVIWCHVPNDYDPSAKRLWRVLVYFGGRNCTGEKEAKGNLGWRKWCDENGVFLVCPGFKDDEYWEPKKWSGKALFQALSEIAKTYRIDTDHLFYYGYSAGSQAANLFAAWRPEKCRGWVSHACGVFHEPGPTMRGVPGLVTCGDVDAARFVIGRAFVAKALRHGESVIWKSFPNRPHDVPAGSLELARAFFAYCSSRFESDLNPYKIPDRKMAEQPFPYVGDDADGIYWPLGSPQAAAILPEDRVVLPSKEVADAWGKPGAGLPAAANVANKAL